ncbi:hypothetical protein ACFZC5_07780 [Nocardia gamkensis]|uniref:hypothetical protein n=1 Tax=Nocardia gamkensis TaxID=352869 RepID=UPI0036E0B160
MDAVAGGELAALPFLGLLPLVLVVVFIATNGRPYYAAGCYGVLIAAGAVRWKENMRRSRVLLTVPVPAISAALLVFSLPLRPEADIEPVADQAEAGLEIAVSGDSGGRSSRRVWHPRTGRCRNRSGRWRW